MRNAIKNRRLGYSFMNSARVEFSLREIKRNFSDEIHNFKFWKMLKF